MKIGHGLVRVRGVARDVEHGPQERRAQDPGDPQELPEVLRPDALGAELQRDPQGIGRGPDGGQFRVGHGFERGVVADLEEVHAQGRGLGQRLVEAQRRGDPVRELPEEGVAAEPDS